MPVQTQGSAVGQTASEAVADRGGDEEILAPVPAAPPFPDADLMYIVDLLPRG